ncbi:MAG: hypothetical protein KatS3mg002_1701 [Candidatus Woesearchaeota archaeon]|nr:MAG: hypothetical protein KatS3mg002_1701 [Candidatus Woesearchaeota archaeon]
MKKAKLQEGLQKGKLEGKLKVTGRATKSKNRNSKKVS